MATIKSYTDIEQSKKLAEILPLESADMFWQSNLNSSDRQYLLDIGKKEHFDIEMNFEHCDIEDCDIPAWSFAALFNILPEINNISPKMEKVKAEDGYDGYYYPIEYEGITLIPYSKNPVDACYEMILKLHELNLL